MSKIDDTAGYDVEGRGSMTPEVAEDAADG